MTIRLNSSDVENISEAWVPGGVVTLQFDKPSAAVIEIETRLNDAAPWMPVEVIRDESFIRLAALPVLRLKLRANKAGQVVRVWSDR